jgi:hypothetical protein
MSASTQDTTRRKQKMFRENGMCGEITNGGQAFCARKPGHAEPHGDYSMAKIIEMSESTAKIAVPGYIPTRFDDTNTELHVSKEQAFLLWKCLDSIFRFTSSPPQTEPVFNGSPVGATGKRGGGPGNGRIFVLFAAELDKEPGQWKKYPTSLKAGVRGVEVAAYATAYHINTGRRKTLPAEFYEAKVDVDNQVWVKRKP